MNYMISLHSEASWKYGPHELCDYLKKDGDTCVVDKKAAIEDDHDARLFFIALGDNYGWNYSPTFESVTAYLEMDGVKLYGGVYNLDDHAKITKEFLASSDKFEIHAPYIYTDEEFAEIAKKISKTS